MSAPLPANEAQRIAALRRFQLLDTAPEAVFDDFVKIASAVCEVPMALMSLVDESRQWLKARVGIEVTETPREHAFCAHTILGEETMVVEDAERDARFAENPLVTSEPHLRFYAGAPLIDSNGNALGALCVLDHRPRELSDMQRDVLERLARRVMAQIEMRSVSAQLAKALEDMKTLSGLLPICAHCKSIRDDEGYWQRVENYMRSRTEAEFSHGICPVCMEKHFPDAFVSMRSRGLI
jgi:GAF domain-containing protein